MNIKKINHNRIKGNYFITDKGKVYDENKKELKTFIDVRGYEQVIIENLPHSIDYLVMFAFEPESDCILIKHKDNNLLNNNWENLEWYYQGEEEESSGRKSLKEVVEYDWDGNIINEYKDISECAEINNLNITTIRNQLKGIRSYTRDGRIFRYKEDSFVKPIIEKDKSNKKEIVYQKVYKFDLDGNLVGEYNNRKECAVRNDIKQGYLYKILSPSSILKGRNKNKGYYYSLDNNFKPIIKVRKELKPKRINKTKPKVINITEQKEIITQEEIKPIEPIKTEPKEILIERPIIKETKNLLIEEPKEIKEENKKKNKSNMLDKIKRFIKRIFQIKEKDNQLELKINKQIKKKVSSKKNKVKKEHRKVYKFDLDGNFIKEYNSPKECYEENNIPKHTFYTCAVRLTSYHNFIYSYDRNTNIKRNVNHRKEILMYDRETNELIKEFKSINKAMRELKVNGVYFYKIINGKIKKDYILKYKED